MHTVNFNKIAKAFNKNVLQCCTVMQTAKALLLKSNNNTYCTATVAALQAALTNATEEDALLFGRTCARSRALKLMQHKRIASAIAQYEDEQYAVASNKLILAMLKRASILDTAYC